MSPNAYLFDMGGTPQQDAALALIMTASMAAAEPDDVPELMSRAEATAVVKGMLQIAVAAGFAGMDRFLTLVAKGDLVPELDALAMDFVTAAGGPDRVFDTLAMAAFPPADLGACQ